MELFSEIVKCLRLERNLSLRQLSALTGISPSAIHSYEMGKRNPKREVLEALSDVFNCDIDYLLGKTNIRNKEANDLGYNSLYDAYKANALPNKKETSIASYAEMSENRRKLIEFAMTVTDEQAERLLQVMKIIVEGDK